LTPLVTKRLQESFKYEDEYDSNEWKKKVEPMKTLIRALSASFANGSEGIRRQENPVAIAPGSVTNEVARAAFFRKLCEPRQGIVSCRVLDQRIAGGG